MPDGRNDIRYGKACLKKALSRRIEMELNALLIFYHRRGECARENYCLDD